VKPTGEHQTVLGISAERQLIDLRVGLPGVEDALGDPDISPELRAELADLATAAHWKGDAWTAEPAFFKRYQTAMADTIGASFLACEGLPIQISGALILKESLQLNDISFEVAMTDLREVPNRPELFSIPTGYREIVR
jgi:hypothetical protein